MEEPVSTVVFLSPPDDAETAYEFFAPFAHIPGQYEWCRIRSPTHGIFDVFIVLGESTAVPATVYVASEAGERFMAERYSECVAIRADSIEIQETEQGRMVSGKLVAKQGPVRQATMTFQAAAGLATQEPYGGSGEPVWGSKFTCWGVDLNLQAKVNGHVDLGQGPEMIDCRGIVAIGSFGRIAVRD